MKKQEQLFHLIKSMTIGEKRYFRKNVIMDKNYLKLFDAIDLQDLYNDNEIKELFKDKKFIKQLHVTKNYLIMVILKSLRNYNSQSSINLKLNNLLSEIEILYQKELLDQCLFIISKSELLAEKYEKQFYLNIILSWKRKVFMQRGRIFNNEEKINEIITEQKKALESAINENEYWRLTIEQIRTFSKPKNEIQEFLDNPLLKNIEEADTLRSKIHYHHIHYSDAITTNRPQKALEHLNILLLELENNPLRIMDDPSSYITTLNNQVSLLLSLKQYDLISKTLQIIREVPTKYEIHNREKISVKLFLRTYNIELEMYRDRKEYKKAEKLINTVENFLIINQKSITRDYQILFFYQFAYIYFMRGKYSKALSWTNKLLQNDITKIREDIYAYSRFLNLMIHYELNNNIVLKYAVDAARKNLRKRRTLFDFEKILLRFFSKISMSRDEERTRLFADLEIKLFAKTDERMKSDVLDYIDFESWINKNLSTL